MDMFDGDGENSDGEFKLSTNNEYAKNYNVWRQKELLNQLKTKYGDVDISSNEEDSSSSEDDDDDDIEIPNEVENNFLKTLSSLKNKDPKIYDDKVNFFADTPIDPTVKKKKKEQSMFLKDYERKMLMDNNLEGDNNEGDFSRGITYVQEQENIKRSLQSQLDKVDDDDGLFQTRVKSKEEETKEELAFKQWLKGQKDTLNDADDETSLKPLKDYWDNPRLDAGEKFLRDYILNNRFKESSDPSYVPTYEEIVHDDENLSEDEGNVEKQEEFEHKFNYRFEEPDQEFLKRYPRTVENSLRKTDDRRKEKRQETKERKVREKQEKMEDIQKLKEIKRKEIEEKIKKLQEITGNTQVGFEDQDIDDDFDPEAHDKRMRALFDEEFYQGEEGDEKPEFPELDEELEIERWDKLKKEDINKPGDVYDDEPHAEDDNFNMDCEYDPMATQQELIENSKGKKKRKRKSKFAKAVSVPKPQFNPNDKTYEEYLDEYYKLDCEDIVGGIPCRFKYRQVQPNNFGLSIDEILTANDKELNRWCSIKKAMQYRPDHVEKYDQIAYSKKGQNEALKRKILPSLFAETVTEPENVNKEAGTSQLNLKIKKHEEKPGKETKKLKRKRDNEVIKDDQENQEKTKIAKLTDKDIVSDSETQKIEKKKKRKNKNSQQKTENTIVNDKNSTSTKEGTPETSTNEDRKSNVDKKLKKKKGNKTAENKNMGDKNQKINEERTNKNKLKKNTTKKIKKNRGKKVVNETKCELSDARLQAFGIKPKKFKNKLKYANNNKS